jgi:hypothetical protein
MKYALANMLNGAGGLNADQLALDLQFAADKTLTARVGPTPTFTRASSGTFVGSNGLIQTAATNVARFDHDPVTLDSRGLLIEESRTNLLLQSETLTTQTRTVTAVAHTLSFYGSGTVVLSGTHSATVVGTGDYPSRRTFTFTPTAGSLTLTVTGTVQYANLEAGSFATSYIPTTTASVVRSADVCSISGAAFSGFYNATEGTSFVSAIKNTNSGNPRPLTITNGTSGNRMEIQRGVTQEQIAYYAGGSFLHELNLGSVALGVNYRIAQAMAANNFAASRDGLTPVTNNSSIMLTADRMIIGANFSGSPGFMNGTISAIRYYRKRLNNAKLQALTV